MRILPSLLFASMLVGCTRPTTLVCREVTEAGVCRGPVSEIDVGRGYQIYATGFGMPHGRVKIRLVELRDGGEVEVAATDIGVVEEDTFLASPLRVSHAGRYRVEVADADGKRFGSVTVNAPRPAFRPIPNPPSR